MPRTAAALAARIAVSLSRDVALAASGTEPPPSSRLGNRPPTETVTRPRHLVSCQLCSAQGSPALDALPRRYAFLVPEDEFTATQSQVREIVVLARDAMDLYESFPHQLARQIAETIASLQPNLRVLHEAVQQVAYSGIGEALQPLLRQIAEMNSISGILARQREAMASIAVSFQPLPVPTDQELWEAEAALRENLPETPEQVKRVVQLSGTIAADPRQRELIRRVGDTLKQADLSKIPPVAFSALLYCWLCHALSLPLTGEATSAQVAEYLAVVSVVLTVLFGSWPRS